MLTQGAVLLAVYTVLLLVVLNIPFLGFILTFFLPLPFLIFTYRFGGAASFLMFGVGCVLTVLVGTPLALIVPITFGLTGMMMGYALQKKWPRMQLLLSTTVIFLIAVVIQYATSIVFFEINIVEEMFTTVEDSMGQVSSILSATSPENAEAFEEQIAGTIDLFQQLIPTLLIISSFVMVLILQAINVPLARRMQVDAPRWSGFHDLSLPRSIIWYYLIILVLQFVVTDPSGVLYPIVLNGLFLMQLLMFFQGLTFLHFYGKTKKWSKTILVLLTVAVFLIPLGFFVLMLLGIIDIGFDLRSRIQKKT